MTKKILTATILLLSLFTYATAQNRSAKEALEGLREIGVIVKYGNADGLEAAMQPTILQMPPVITEDAVRQVLNRQIDEFIKAYNTANPKNPRHRT